MDTYRQENLVVDFIKRKTERKYWSTEELTKIEIQASNEEVEVILECVVTDVGTYRNDNVKKISKLMTIGTKFDLVEGELGYGINLNPSVKAYYSKDCYIMPDEFIVKEKRKQGEKQ
jgi:hypothetical protein